MRREIKVFSRLKEMKNEGAEVFYLTFPELGPSVFPFQPSDFYFIIVIQTRQLRSARHNYPPLHFIPFPSFVSRYACKEEDKGRIEG